MSPPSLPASPAEPAASDHDAAVGDDGEHREAERTADAPPEGGDARPAPREPAPILRESSAPTDGGGSSTPGRRWRALVATVTVVGVTAGAAWLAADRARLPLGSTPATEVAGPNEEEEEEWNRIRERVESRRTGLSEARSFGMIGMQPGTGARGAPVPRAAEEGHLGSPRSFGIGHGPGLGSQTTAGRRYGSPPRGEAPGFDTEAYRSLPESGFVAVADDPRSTFSIDVDTASYTLVRRHLETGRLPPSGAVRIEEMLNYFRYAYPVPESDVPFAVGTEVTQAPWEPRHQLVRIGVRGRHVSAERRPPANLVFLVDVSGSMRPENKLPLLQRGLAMLTQRLDARDRVSLVVYAGTSGLVLPPTPGDRKTEILEALADLQAGGSTNGGEGILLAYRQAREGFRPGGINRVVLATDGDFNVGITSESDLVGLIEEKRREGVYLSVLGFGTGNYQDGKLEQLADKGNGNYAYVDSIHEARRVLVEQAMGTLMTIAKDVKIQVELNPARVAGFRLIGYEDRRLAHRDFTDDGKDAGEIGADHTVTALYELVPAGLPVPGGEGAPLRYQVPAAAAPAAATDELMTVKLRFKPPASEESQALAVVVRDASLPLARATDDLRFAAAVAAFGLLLRGSEHRGNMTWDDVLELARGAQGDDASRQELVGLVARAKGLAG